ncbi:MAG: hypothetical protein H6710_04430 [Myxococcales bacterium]|nr:hypothetical protein [Myxococcales bacterium]MCB9705695.1 hypothetical protein [Myxococcales bacterium]
MHPLLTPAGRAAIEEATAAIEERTSAEVMVAVRRRSGLYHAAAIVLGIIAAVVTQALLLYSEPEFPLPLFIVGPLCAGGFASLLGRVPAIERLLSRGLRRHTVRQAAEAAFTRLGAGHTRAHTGVVVYLSLAERMVEVVADSGVLRQRPLEAWDDACAALDRALAGDGRPEALTRALAGLGDVLALALPWRDDDVDELPNLAVEP